jgi:hypothetical protein
MKMNIDDLTVAQCKEIAAMFPAQNTAPTDSLVSKHVGKFVIVRTYASGVFFAKLEKHAGRMAELSYSRRLWVFKAAEGISLSAVALNGVDPKKSKFPAAIPEQTVLDCLEFIPATDVCRASIESTPEAVQS